MPIVIFQTIQDVRNWLGSIQLPSAVVYTVYVIIVCDNLVYTHTEKPFCMFYIPFLVLVPQL